MKAIYWVPRRASRRLLLGLTVLSLAGVVVVEAVGRSRTTPYDAEMLRAAELAEACLRAIKTEAVARGVQIDARYDPTMSGLIGRWMSPVTSSYGSLGAKQTSVNPNFAAVAVEMLRRAGVREGDAVAVGYSGSFPALNACLCAAMEVLKVRPVIIASAAASQWGANRPELMWVDMEHLLQRRGLIGFRSVAASLGGGADRAADMSAEGRRMLAAAIERNGLPLIETHGNAADLARRMELYRAGAAGRRIAAYVNVGGASISVGTLNQSQLVGPGLTLHPRGAIPPGNTVVARFAAQDVPVINLADLYILAPKCGLPWRPASFPKVGRGGVYGPLRYSRPLAGLALGVVLAAALAGALLRRPARA